nr:hypothetical protein CFP56_15302 [Quercus suber]
MADKTVRPFPRKDGVKPDSMNVKLHVKANKQGRHLVQSQRNEGGLSNYEPMFSFGERKTYAGTTGPSPTSLIFSSPASSPSKVSILKPKIRDVALGVHKNGDHEQLGNLLPRQSHFGRGGNNQVDQARPDGGMGWFDLEFMIAWKNLFPLTEASKRLGYLPMEDKAWALTLNLWWRFLSDRPAVQIPPQISLEPSTTRSNMHPLKKSLSEAELQGICSEIMVRKFLLVLPVECTIWGNLHQVKLL